MSSSDDKTVRLWDVASEKEISCMTESTDYVRALTVASMNAAVFAAGSYDGFARIYDANEGQLLLTVNHGAPIEKVLFLGEGSALLTIGGSSVKLWDILSNGTLKHEFPLHQKAITSCWLSPKEDFLLTGSLDKQVKVLSLKDYRTIFCFSFSSAILSLGLSSRGNRIVVGLADGSLAFRTRKIASIGGGELQNPILSIETTTAFEKEHGKKLNWFNRLLKKFNYRSAFRKVVEVVL